MYLTTLEQLEKIAKGELKVDEIATPQNMALLTWSGSDVEYLIKAKKKDINIDEGYINDIKHMLDHTDCGTCINVAIDENENYGSVGTKDEN